MLVVAVVVLLKTLVLLVLVEQVAVALAVYQTTEFKITALTVLVIQVAAVAVRVL
jgi:hypothetical protein